MTFDPVAFANRGARSFQYDELNPPPASRTRAGSAPSTTWKTSSCSAFTTLRVSNATDADALEGADVPPVGADVAGGVEHAVSSRAAEKIAIALRRRGFGCLAMGRTVGIP